MLADKPLTIATLLRTFFGSISITWLLTLCETAMMSLIPLFIGFAIDGLLNEELTALRNLGIVFAALIVISVIRRVYDTRVYGTLRVELGSELVTRSAQMPVSRQNARLDMGRELVDFLEREVPELMNSVVQLVVSLAILFLFHPVLAYSAVASAIVMVGFYLLFHRRFYRLNGNHNQQTEKQVHILETRLSAKVRRHLGKLRNIEVQLSDTEAYVYGAIFFAMTGFILFNLWFAATHVETTVGTIFAIVSYSWEFVESALVLPVTLQGWSRLSEIMNRINNTKESASAR